MTAGDGPALGEEARLAIWGAVQAVFEAFEAGDPPAMAEAAAWIETGLDSHIRALLVQARADGAAEPVDGDGTRVTAVDLANGGTESQTVRDDYVLVCDGSAYLDGVVAYGNGTHVLTVKGVKRRGH